MLVGKIKSEEDLLENGCAIVEPSNGIVSRYKLVTTNDISYGQDKGISGYMLRAVQNYTVCVVPTDTTDFYLAGTLKTLMTLLNKNEFNLYYV